MGHEIVTYNSMKRKETKKVGRFDTVRQSFLPGVTRNRGTHKGRE